MRKINIGHVVVTHEGATSTIRCEVTLDGSPRHLEYTVPGDRRGDPRLIDAFVTVSLIGAMRFGDVLQTAEPVSPRLLSSLDEIQAIYSTWYPDELSPVRIEAAARETDDVPAQEVAVCFTGGVDSFYALLRHLDDLTYLMYVEGYDVPRYNTAVLEQKRRHTEAVASATGTRPITASSNVKAFCLETGRWGQLTSGPALAAAAQLLAPGTFGRVLVPSGDTYAGLRPWGYHPLVDPLWGTEYLSITHVDADTDRMAKTTAIMDSSVAREHLHVCLRSNADYNCGTCYKCVRTMVTLETAGVLGEFSTLPDTLDLDLVRRTPPRGKNEAKYALINRTLAEAAGMADLAAALTDGIREHERSLEPDVGDASLPDAARAWRDATAQLAARARAAAAWRTRRLGRRLRRARRRR